MWQPLIVCSGPDCTFASLILLVKNLITDLIILSTFLAVVAFAYAGFLLMTSGGSESGKDKAKKIFTKVLIGYVWILGAWVIVYTISTVLLKPGFYFSK
jgi:putative copper export protein